LLLVMSSHYHDGIAGPGNFHDLESRSRIDVDG